MRRQLLSTQQQFAQSQQQLAQIPLNLTAQQNDIRSKLAVIEQALANNEAQRAWVLRAPRAGVVSTLLLKPGQTVSAGQSLLAVLPAGSTLEAQLLVPSQAIGFVRSGQRVVLRYQAFPYQKFGLHEGIVTQVSRSALSPQEVSSLMGQQVTVPLYRVMVRLGQQ
ncbi:secretion protein HlyD family protein, partial [mine drainage metagenome]